MLGDRGVTLFGSVPLCADGVVVVELRGVPPGAQCVGVNENLAQFEVDGRERTYELPFFNGGRVRIERLRLGGAGDICDVDLLAPDPSGALYLEVYVDSVGGRWFAVGRPSAYVG